MFLNFIHWFDSNLISGINHVDSDHLTLEKEIGSYSFSFTLFGSGKWYHSLGSFLFWKTWNDPEGILLLHFFSLTWTYIFAKIIFQPEVVWTKWEMNFINLPEQLRLKWAKFWFCVGWILQMMEEAFWFHFLDFSQPKKSVGEGKKKAKNVSEKEMYVRVFAQEKIKWLPMSIAKTHFCLIWNKNVWSFSSVWKVLQLCFSKKTSLRLIDFWLNVFKHGDTCVTTEAPHSKMCV